LGILDVDVLLVFEAGLHFVIFLKGLSVRDVSVLSYFGFCLGFLLLSVSKIRYGIKQSVMANHADKTGNSVLLGP
jgi:hypothetical protein